jgi:hypothetical protein
MCKIFTFQKKISILLINFIIFFSNLLVITVPSGTKAIKTLRNRDVGCPPTILLIDIDHTESVSRDLYARRESFLVMEGVTLSEIHTKKDTLYGLELLKYVNSEISKGTLERVIPIGKFIFIFYIKLYLVF